MSIRNCIRPGCAVILLLAGGTASSQDLATITLLQPQSGCALSAAQAIRIRSVNYGATLPGASMFDYAYRINGGPPVVERVFMGNPIPPNGTVNYTFNTTADLSQPGIHQIDAAILVAGDSHPDNDWMGPQPVQNWAPTVGGALPSLPIGASGVLDLSGQLGAVIEWQQSLDGERWRSLQNVTSQQGYSGLTQSVQFRVLVQNGPCAPALSTSTRAAPDPILANGFENP